MSAARQRRPTSLRKAELDRAYAFAEQHGLKVRGLRSHPDGGFTLDFGDAPANDDDLDRELRELEDRHGQS